MKSAHTLEADVVRKAWTEARQRNPKLRNRDIAAELGIAEAALVASRCGHGVQRLRPEWPGLLRAFEPLGTVQALTRNEHAVIEKDGRYRNIEEFGQMGQVLDEGIDLRIFFRNWAIGFAVQEETPRDIRFSFQFFAPAGEAVHKVFLRKASDVAVFSDIVDRFSSTDQSPALQLIEPEPPATELPDQRVDVAALRTAWNALRDTHDFHRVLRAHQVTRTQAFRLAGPELARPVANDTLQHVLNGAAAAHLPVMIFVSNSGVTQIHSGPIQRVVTVDKWLNILDPGFSLHVREDQIAQSWVVRKPTDHGVITSLELYSASEEQVLLMVSKRQPGQEETTEWRELVDAR